MPRNKLLNAKKPKKSLSGKSDTQSQITNVQIPMRVKL